MNHHFTNMRRAFVVALCLGLLVVALGALTASAANTVVTPGSPDGWGPTDVRTNATVGITNDNPRDGLGSLKFTTNTIISGQDKADFTKTWTDPTRTLGVLSDVSFEYYRDATSTTAAHFIPALRLLWWQDNAPTGASPGPEDHTGYLVWEGIYNGIPTAPTNSWEAENLFAQNFWMRLVSGPNTAGGCGKTIQNFNATLNDWLTGTPQGQPGDCVAPDIDATTYITGVNTGVGSGWGATFLGYVDNVVVTFGADAVSANFEPNPVCTTVCYADAVGGNDANGGTSAADAKKTIQAAVNAVQAGGEVRVLPGTYPESPSVNKSLTLVSTGGRDVTFIALQTGTNYTHSLLITGAEVTVDGFTIVGIDAACPTLAATNIYLDLQPDNVVITNNRMRVGAIDGACSTGDDGFGLITQFSGNPDVASLTVTDNIFEPLNTAGQRAYYINPSVIDFTFRGNEITGQFNGTSVTEAQNNLIEWNTVTGTGASGGFGIWGYLDPGLWGTGSFANNTITGTANAISIYDAENVTVTKNTLDGNGRGVRVLDAAFVTFDLSTIHINRNAITNNTTIGILNSVGDYDPYGVYIGDTDVFDVDATCNWWGDASGPGPVGPGSGDMVSTDVDFAPFLSTADLDGLCADGIFMSARTAGTTADGVAFGPHDILKWDGTEWSKWFDGSAAGLMPNGRAKHNVNALWIPNPSGNEAILSFGQNSRNVPGITGKVDGMDLVRWDGSAFSLWFDGSDVGLTNKTQEKIDALHVLPGSASPIGGSCQAYLLISTQGPGRVGNPSFRFGGEDVLGFCATNLGANTAGFWHMVLDGSAEGMPRNATDSISLSADGNTLWLTTQRTFNVDSASGGHSMVYAWDMTTQTFSGPIFSAPANGFPKTVNALDITDLP